MQNSASNDHLAATVTLSSWRVSSFLRNW